MKFVEYNDKRHIVETTMPVGTNHTECGLYVDGGYTHAFENFKKKMPLCGQCKRLVLARLKKAEG